MNKTICVFCGSSAGNDKIYETATINFAKEIVKNNLTLVYGGGNFGIMGILSDTVISNGGKVIGVIPKFLADKNLGSNKITEMKTVKNMHERKKTMYELSDYFVAMPGGIGTLEEITEILTWKQLSLHKKPCALLNINHFFDYLILFLQTAVNNGFMKQSHLDNLIIESDYTQLINKLESYKFNQEEKF